MAKRQQTSNIKVNVKELNEKTQKNKNKKIYMLSSHPHASHDTYTDASRCSNIHEDDDVFNIY